MRFDTLKNHSPMDPARQISMKEFHSLGLYRCSSIPMFLIFPIILSTSSPCWLLFSISASLMSAVTMIFSRMLQQEQCSLATFFHSSNCFSNSKYILKVLVSIWCRLGRKYLQRFLSSLSRDLSVRMQGMIRKMSASLHSTISLNLSYFSEILSIVPEKCSRCRFFSLSQKQFPPFSQDFSYSISVSTRSELFFSCGSTIYMFLSYFLNKFLRLVKEFRIFQPRMRMALDWSLVMRRRMPSVSRRMEWSRSSLPLPQQLAIWLIWLMISHSLALVDRQSQQFMRILPFIFSLISTEVRHFSASMALAIRLLACTYMLISSSTYSLQKVLQLTSNSSKFSLISPTLPSSTTLTASCVTFPQKSLKQCSSLKNSIISLLPWSSTS